MSIDLAPYPLAEAREAGAIRLVPARDGVVLLLSRKDSPEALAWAPAEPDGSAPRPFATLRSRLGAPAWDVTHNSGGSWVFVSTAPGSAVSHLFFQRAPEDRDVQVTGRYPTGIFTEPRFVRGGAESSLPISALSSGPDGEEVVLFRQREGEGYGEAASLWAPRPGRVQQAVVLRQGTGYLVLAKIYIPGTVPVDAAGRLPERVDAMGESSLPGIVAGLRLDAGLRPAGPEMRPLGDRLVFDFDADVAGAAGDRAILLATTAEGLLLAAGAPAEGQWWSRDLSETVSPEPLTTPRLAVAQGRVHLAVIASAGTDRMRILVGSTPAAVVLE